MATRPARSRFNQASRAARADAAAEAERLFPAARQAAESADRVVLAEVPDSLAGVHLGRNALPSALAPPFTLARPHAQVGVFLDLPPNREALAALARAERPDDGIRWLRWSGETFVPFEPEPWTR